MATNLIESFHSKLSELLIQQGSRLLGESTENSIIAVKAIVPAVLAAIEKKGNTDVDAAQLLTYLDENGIDGSILSNVAGKLEGNIETEKLLYSGAVLSRFLLNDKIGTVVDLISDSSGIKTSSATSFLKLIAPLLMGMVGKHKVENGLDASGLKNLLQAQQPFIKSSLPPGMAEALGLNAKENPKPSPSSNTNNPVQAEAGKPFYSKILPWAVLGIAALGIFYFIQKKPKINVPEEPAPAVLPIDTPSVDKQKVVNPFKDYTLPDGSTLSAIPSSFTGQVASFLQGQERKDKCIPFDKVGFEDGSFKITDRSEAQLTQLVKLLNAYPDVKIRLEGHTDEEGESGKNKTLSKERAKLIKTWLTDHQIAAGRIDIKGWGEEKPVASNETKWGREQNRRIEVCLTMK